ncbi:hypothetical protein Q1695_008929 [Nippostrongylus brasiliensis]|nr:hypothetical protein Q1695_008929 [Nippostrongylus brasiliensis]
MEVAVKGRTYDVAKMELFAFQFQAYDQPNVVRQLVQNMTARHLALTINVDSSTKPQTTRVLGQWYQLLYWLFYSQGYALIGASSSGICGTETQNCVYRVSLMRVDSAKDRLQLSAPVFGLGSPKEELGRLVSYLHKSECSTSASSEFPLFCSDILHEQSTVLLVT